MITHIEQVSCDGFTGLMALQPLGNNSGLTID
jgi:hypothetical protein